MMKLYTFAMALLMGTALVAQRNVTFQVDMSGQTVSADSVYIAGNFQDTAGFAGNWDPSATQLTQVGTSNIYEVTVIIPDGQYEFKYLSGTTWNKAEGVPAVSQVSLGKGYDNSNGNRYVKIHSDTTLPAIEFGGNAPANHENLTFLVDMEQQSMVADTVSIAGNFQGWTPGKSIAFDYLGDSLYRYVAYIPTGDTVNFKYLNGAAWGTDESVPAACAVNSNRQIIVSGDSVAGPTCFGQCGACFVPDTFNVTFQVDMSAVCGFDPATDTVSLAGPFNGWPGGVSPDVATDPDGDMVYTYTGRFPAPSLEYKARFHDTSGTNWEGGANNIVNFNGDTTVPVRCFGFDTVGACLPKPAPSDITFEVDLSQATVSFTKVFLIGDFTTPPWQSGAVEMTPTGTPGVFSTTISGVCPGKIAYKYMVEDGSANQTEEDFANANDTTCLEPSGTGSFNRFYIRPDDQPKTLSSKWNDCETIGLEEAEALRFSVYPNPFRNATTVALGTGEHHLKVYNSTGALVHEVNEARGEVVLRAENLGTGVFLLQVQDEKGQRRTQKIMVR